MDGGPSYRSSGYLRHASVLGGIRRWNGDQAVEVAHFGPKAGRASSQAGPEFVIEILLAPIVAYGIFRVVDRVVRVSDTICFKTHSGRGSAR